MHFRLTARDGFDNGGGLGYDEVTLRIDPNAGPFLVTSFAKGGTRQGPDVQGHRVEGQRHQEARQRRSASCCRPTAARPGADARHGRPQRRQGEGADPAVKTKKARIMIAANGNYFFDVNDKKFKIR